MTNERLETLLYNALTYLQDEYGCDFSELEEELSITKDEYQEIVEDSVCCAFGKDELREGIDVLIGNATSSKDSVNIAEIFSEHKMER